MFSKNKQSKIIPNHYEMDQLPYLILQNHPLDHSLNYFKNLAIRNITHQYSSIFCKIFAFWPKYSQINTESQQFDHLQKQAGKDSLKKMLKCQITLMIQLPIISADKLVYIYHDLLKQSKIIKQQWNFVGEIQNFKQTCSKLIQQLFMSQNQMKFKYLNNAIAYNVYFNLQRKQFVLKACIKSLDFEICSSFQKKKYNIQNFQQGLVIKNKKVCKVLQKMTKQKVEICSKSYLNNSQSQIFHKKIIEKYINFYQIHQRHMDQQILKLQVYHNFPNLRTKYFIPYKFVDMHDNQPLIGPIFSNVNKNCMYGHFAGYNSNTCFTLFNTNCEYCGVKINQLKKNMLLEYLRDNLYNYAKFCIQYCPEFNRFKLMVDVRAQKQLEEQQKQMHKILRRLSIKQKSEQEIEKEQVKKQKQQKIQQKTDKNQQRIQEYNKQVMESDMVQQGQNIEKQVTFSPKIQLKYANFMHFLSVIKKQYSKKRTKIMPQVQVQKINYKFTFLSQHQNSKQMNSPNLTNAKMLKQQNYSTPQQIIQSFNTDQIFQKFEYELTYPARGKLCNHFQFADLRAYYKTMYIKSNGFVNQPYFTCPICGIELKDSQIVYLKQIMPLIKVIKKQIQKSQQNDQQLNLQFSPEQMQFYPQGNGSNKQNKIHIYSARIIINNLMQQVFIQFFYNSQNGQKQGYYYKQIDNIYKTIQDPYVPFSEYSLGLKNTHNTFYGLDALNQQNSIENSIKNKEKEWFNKDIAVIKL